MTLSAMLCHATFKIPSPKMTSLKITSLKITSLKTTTLLLSHRTLDCMVSYSGHKIIPIGKARFQCQHKNVIHQITFQIIDEEAPSLLGRKTCLELGLIERIMTINQSDCGNNGDDILNQ